MLFLTCPPALSSSGSDDLLIQSWPVFENADVKIVVEFASPAGKFP